MCRIASLFLLQKLKQGSQATRAISTTSRRELSSRFFFLARQGAEGNSRHSAETSGEYVPSYTTVKNWVSQFKHGDFSTCDAPRPGRTKTVTITEIIDQIHELFLEDSRISTNQ